MCHSAARLRLSFDPWRHAGPAGPAIRPGQWSEWHLPSRSTPCSTGTRLVALLTERGARRIAMKGLPETRRACAGKRFTCVTAAGQTGWIAAHRSFCGSSASSRTPGHLAMLRVLVRVRVRGRDRIGAAGRRSSPKPSPVVLLVRREPVASRRRDKPRAGLESSRHRRASNCVWAFEVRE